MELTQNRAQLSSFGLKVRVRVHQNIDMLSSEVKHIIFMDSLELGIMKMNISIN